MRRLVAMRPGRGNTADHPADMTIGLDQLGDILGRQNEACLAGETDDFIVGGRIGHIVAPALLFGVCKADARSPPPQPQILRLVRARSINWPARPSITALAMNRLKPKACSSVALG